MKSTISQLQNWYATKCDGEWEHSHSVRIENIDNPGWKVELTGECNRNHINFKLDSTEDDWISISATDNKFVGYGGVNNLDDILEYLINWLQ